MKGIIYLTFAAGYLTFIVFGIVLYWMRENQRWLYGLVEIAAALALVFITLFFLGVGGPKPDVGTNIYTIPFVTHLLQMLAAIYFLVRGLDNLGQGLRKFPVWNRRWRWLSLKPVDDVTKLKSDGQ
ncbi:hypothetical protein [Mesorhizobium sp. BR-1-1-10]|uniref:hypothetical protein n=1 Tax=Mesorhizobium sp. BR-1-1-10 TaxID=2876660 RepID=UPI001CD1803E|nr:hypothetical protein [Mesorhizobium sp. BR-1-1-10]MBZ9975509.1 hypothetical protein [Mesorhizobium sp. BR-1-1-10]